MSVLGVRLKENLNHPYEQVWRSPPSNGNASICFRLNVASSVNGDICSWVSISFGNRLSKPFRRKKCWFIDWSVWSYVFFLLYQCQDLGSWRDECLRKKELERKRNSESGEWKSRKGEIRLWLEVVFSLVLERTVREGAGCKKKMYICFCFLE